VICFLTDTQEAALCESNEDEHGTMWNQARSGQVMSTACPPGFKGFISRRCGNDGQWLLPVYNCVSEQILMIENKVN